MTVPRTRYHGGMIRTAILTVSDKGAAGERADTTVEEIRKLLAAGPFVEVDYQLVPDEQALIRARLRLWSDSDEVDLILTNGGTGLGLRDRTPEATRDVIEREIPGVAEAMRSRGARSNPLALLSRGMAGVRRKTLILNLPGGRRPRVARGRARRVGARRRRRDGGAAHRPRPVALLSEGDRAWKSP